MDVERLTATECADCMVKVTFKDRDKQTPEVQAWLDEVSQLLSAKLEKEMHDWMSHGTLRGTFICGGLPLYPED